MKNFNSISKQSKTISTTKPNLEEKIESNRRIKPTISEESINSNMGSFRTNTLLTKNEIFAPQKHPKSNIELPINLGEQTRKISELTLTTRSVPKKTIFMLSSQRKVSNNVQKAELKIKRNDKDNTKGSENEYSQEYTKGSNISQVNDKFNSNTSYLKNSDISSEDISHGYKSENTKQIPILYENKKLDDSELSDEKNSFLFKTNSLQSKYQSNKIGEKSGLSNTDRNNIPLTNKDPGNKKELTSIRLSMHPKQQEIPLIREKPVSYNEIKLKPEIRKRNPSINNINKIKEFSSSNTDKKRSKSENYGMVKIETNLIEIKDVISFIKSKEETIPAFEPAKTVVKKYGAIDAFVVNTHKGSVRKSNEDRVSILLNAQNKFLKFKGSKSDFNCSMFSVFDGHGGTACCNYLKEHLNNTLLDQLDVEGLIVPSIKGVYKKLDEDYIQLATQLKQNFAGSCANTLIVINDSLMVVNTGDSRTIFSHKNGSRITEASSDHKPEKISEFNRILEKGGELYRMSSNVKNGQNNFYFVKNYIQLKKTNELQKTTPGLIFGPWRVKPGGLSVSRSFGDIESKKGLNTNMNGIIMAEPDITEFDLSDVDFAFLACNLNS